MPGPDVTPMPEPAAAQPERPRPLKKATQCPDVTGEILAELRAIRELLSKALAGTAAGCH